MPSGESLGGGSWSRMSSGQTLGQPKEKQAEAVLSPEMVMAEFDRQVGTIHCTIDVLFAQTITTLSSHTARQN